MGLVKDTAEQDAAGHTGPLPPFRLCHQMTRLLLAIVGLGLLASVSPSTLIAFVALLASRKAQTQRHTAFLVGWNVSLSCGIHPVLRRGEDHTVDPSYGRSRRNMHR
jgi:hypothetical protein